MKKVTKALSLILLVFGIHSCAENITESAPTIFDNLVDDGKSCRRYDMQPVF